MVLSIRIYVILSDGVCGKAGKLFGLSVGPKGRGDANAADSGRWYRTRKGG